MVGDKTEDSLMTDSLIPVFDIHTMTDLSLLEILQENDAEDEYLVIQKIIVWCLVT